MEKTSNAASSARVVSMCGMTLAWTGIHNQLLYPVTFTYGKDLAPSPYLLHLVYFGFMALFCLAVAIAHERVSGQLLASRSAIVGTGAAGAAGALLVIMPDFSAPAHSMAVMVGLALTALYTCLHFVFWSGQLCNGDRKLVPRDAILSFLLFCLVTAARLALGIHQSVVAIVFPLASAALAPLALAGPQRSFPSQAAGLRQMPRDVLGAAVALAYLCAALVALFDPDESMSAYPRNRVLLYLINLALFAVVLLVFHRTGKSARRSSTVSFAVIALYLAGAVSLTAYAGGATGEGGFQLGNYALIAAKMAAITYAWLLIVTSTRVKHLDQTLPTALFLLLVAQLPNALTVLAHFTEQNVGDSLGSPEFAALLFGAAFAISLLLNAVLLLLFVRMSKDLNASARTAARHDESLADSVKRVAASYGLSAREAEILQLSYEHASAKKVAEVACIAESTVYTHVRNIYRKADVHSRQQLIDLVDRFRTD